MHFKIVYRQKSNVFKNQYYLFKIFVKCMCHVMVGHIKLRNLRHHVC